MLAIFRPLMPYVDYYMNYDYIAEQLCENRNKPVLACNGKCYLSKELANTQTEDQQGREQNLPKIDMEKIPVSTIPNTNIHFFKNAEKMPLRQFCVKVPDTSSFIDFIFRPPKNLV